MSGLKTIRRRISSVKNTKQITRAMKLVSAAKLRRAQDAAQGGRAYGKKLAVVVGTLLRDITGDFEHPLVSAPREVKRRRVVVISGDRGLCGGYNANIVKAIAAAERAHDIQLDFVAIGRRSISAAHRLGWNLVAQFENLGEDAGKWPIEEISSALTEDFAAGKIDEVVVYYTHFVTPMTQRVTREVLLPFQISEGAGETDSPVHSSSVSYSPEPEKILAGLIPVLIRTRLRQAALESKASEHAARMTAMDAATSNANDLIEKLRLFYNRARQTAITRDLIDIVGGAEALK